MINKDILPFNYSDYEIWDDYLFNFYNVVLNDGKLIQGRVAFNEAEVDFEQGTIILRDYDYDTDEELFKYETTFKLKIQ